MADYLSDEGRRDLRDRFAMAALQGLLACPTTSNQGLKRIDFAIDAYRFADAMLDERDRRDGGGK